MKYVYYSALICLIAGVSYAQPTFDYNLPRFQIGNSEIKWEATKHLQSDLWVYKVIPQTFSVVGINELLRQGLFTNTVTKGSESLAFVNSSNTCNLHIDTAQGCITYWNEYAPANHWDSINHLWEQVEGLPTESEIETRGLEVLEQFGIQRNELSQRTDGHLITFGEKQSRSYYDRRTQTNIDSEVKARGIYFKRRVNGIDFAGIGLRGGCEIEFGNHANISEFKLVWRNLQPYEHYMVASTNEMIQFIRDGKAVLTHGSLVNPTEVKSITITDVLPLYMGEGADKPQDFVYPFAQVNARVNLGYTNEDVQLFCPILSTNLVK